MKRTLITIAVILGLLPILSAHPVDEATAHNIASKFMGTNDIQLSKTYQTDQNSPALFIFNTENGFVIVAADDCETPIIGYSHEGSFDPNDIPVQMEEYLQDFANRIQYGIENQIIAIARCAMCGSTTLAIFPIGHRRPTAGRSATPSVNRWRWASIIQHHTVLVWSAANPSQIAIFGRDGKINDNPFTDRLHLKPSPSKFNGCALDHWIQRH